MLRLYGSAVKRTTHGQKACLALAPALLDASLPMLRRLLPSAPGVERARRLLRLVLQALSPHFCLARGVHLVGGGGETFA